MTTYLGALSTLMIMTVTCMFALIKLEQLLLNKNPSIMSYSESLVKTESFDATQGSEMIAFALGKR